MVIIATNSKKNIDEAFIRRLNLVLDFPMPDAMQRKILWEKFRPDEIIFADDLDLEQLAENYELSGASIMNVVQYSLLKCLERNSAEIQSEDIIAGILREKSKL